MKKTIISITLFISIFSFAIYSHIILINVGTIIISKCNTIETELNAITKDEEKDPDNEVWHKIYEQSLDLDKYIFSNYSMISLYLNHERIDYLTAELSRLHQYTKEGDLKESLSTINYLKSYMKTILREEDFSIRNIF